MSTAVLSPPRATALPRLAGYGALAGLAGGIGMAIFQMIQSAATSNGFWTPLNLCMASFVWRGQAAMIEKDMMMHPGMSMNMPVAGGHLAVGMILHLAFSMVVGIVFISVLFALRGAGLGVLRTAPAYVAATVAGAALLYVVQLGLEPISYLLARCEEQPHEPGPAPPEDDRLPGERLHQRRRPGHRGAHRDPRPPL